MDKINFYVDEVSVAIELGIAENFPENAKILIAAINDVARLDISDVFFNTDFYETPIGKSSLYAMLFKEEVSPAIRDLLVQFQISIGKAKTFQSTAISDHGKTALKNNKIGGLISLSKAIPEWWDENLMEFISKGEQAQKFIRKLFLNLNLPLPFLSSYSSSMFPEIHFHTPIENIKNIGIEYTESIKPFIEHLSYLNDEARVDFRGKLTNHEIISKAKISISPENSKTHKDKAAMKERTIKIANNDIVCEWHSKLEGHRGRIYFYPRLHPDENVKKIVKGKLIVGIIANHLK